MFQFTQFRSPPDLQCWVRLVWALTANDAGGAHANAAANDGAERVVPDGHPELIFNLGAPFEQRAPGRSEFRVQPSAIVNGQLRASMMLRPTGAVQLIGIRLQPWALGALAQTSAAQLSDAWFSVSDMSSRLLPDLGEALAGCLTHADAFRTAVAHMRVQFRTMAMPPQRLVSLVKLLSDQATRRDLSAIRDDVGLSERVMQRLFRNEVGLTPKQFTRVVRIQQAVRIRRDNMHVTWARAATEAGYFDQSHFNKDFRSIVGCTPTALLMESESLTGSLLDSPDDVVSPNH